MIDWELIGVMVFFVIAGLITVTVMLHGLSRTEKTLGTIFLLAFAAQMVTLNVYAIPEETPEFDSFEQIDSWLASMDRAMDVANALWWVCVLVAAAFLMAGVHHIWQQRETVLAKVFRVE